MDEVLRAVLTDHQILVDALQAMSKGQDESVAFLAIHDPSYIPQSTTTLRESIALAERVAFIALGTQKLDTFHGPLLRKMLVTYGNHLDECGIILGTQNKCTCSWGSILPKIQSQLAPPENGEKYTFEGG